MTQQTDELITCGHCYNDINTNNEHTHVIEKLDHLELCCDCFHQKYFDCDECNESFFKEEIHEYKEYWYCENCYNECKKEIDEQCLQ